MKMHRMDSLDKIIISIFVTVGVIFVLAIVSAIGLTIQETKHYNNGVCIECGGRYSFYQAIGHKDCTTYLYRCNKCGDMVEMQKIM